MMKIFDDEDTFGFNFYLMQWKMSDDTWYSIDNYSEN